MSNIYFNVATNYYPFDISTGLPLNVETVYIIYFCQFVVRIRLFI